MKLKKRSRPAKFREMVSGIRRILRHIAPYMPPHRGLMAGAAFALIAATLMRLAEPWPLKFVIDRVVTVSPERTGSGIAFVDALSQTELLALCAALVIVSIGLRAAFEYASTIGFALAGSRILAQVRHDLYRHLQRLSLAFHDRTRTGDITMRIVGDVGMLREAAVTAILPLATNVLILVGMSLVMLSLNWKLALLALAPLPLLALTTIRIGGRIQKVSRDQRGNEGNIAAATAETMTGMRVVQALSLEDKMAHAFKKQNEGSLTDGVKAKRLTAGLERSTDLLIGVSMALTLWYGTLLVLRGALTPGDLIVFITYLKSAFKPVRDFAKNSGRLAKATASGERIVDLLEIEPEIVDRPGATHAPPFKGAVRFDSLFFNYAGGGKVLSDFELVVNPGEMLALVGPSGAGKSTVASLLLRLYDPVLGRIRIDGHDIRDFTLASLRQQISVVLQDGLLFSDTVRENIALARPDASDAEIEAAARLANAHDFIVAMPEGYDTILAERGVSLSMGQRQRLAIARAALRPSPILILDEPTAGLDRENERLVIDALKRLASGRTVLLITHDLDLAGEADRIAVIESGRIVETGDPDTLLRAQGAYARFYRARSAAFAEAADAVAS